MKLELNIKEDKVLRDEIKEMVRGQVISITREALNKYMIGEVVRKKGYDRIKEIDKVIDIFEKDVKKEITKSLDKFKFIIEANKIQDLIVAEIKTFMSSTEIKLNVSQMIREEITRFIAVNFKSLLK